MTQGVKIETRTRAEVIRLAALRDVDGRPMWTMAAIARAVGLEAKTVAKILRDRSLQVGG
jgi:hypothetical protein